MRQSSKLQISALCFPEADCPVGCPVFVGQGPLTIPFPFSPFILLFLISSTLIGCFFHTNLTPIEQEQGLVQHPRPRLWTNWRENGTETRFLSPSQCKGTVSFWLKNWLWRLIVKTFSSKRSLAPRGSTTPRSGKEPSSWTLTSSARFAKLWIQKLFPFSPFRRCT